MEKIFYRTYSQNPKQTCYLFNIYTLIIFWYVLLSFLKCYKWIFLFITFKCYLFSALIEFNRKVLACVVCGRLKSAFQIASRSGSVADVQYVAHQVLLPLIDYAIASLHYLFICYHMALLRNFHGTLPCPSPR